MSIGVVFHALVFCAFLVAAAISDLRSLRIPNGLCAAMAALGPVAVYLTIPETGAATGAILTGLITLAVGWAMFEMGWLGGGDAKLAAAASLWLGSTGTLVFALVTALFGAILAAALLLLSRWEAGQSAIGETWRLRLRSGPVSVPYAVAMAPAGLWALSVRLDGLY